MKKWFFLSLVLLLSLPGQASARHGQPGRWHTSFEIGPDGDTISVVPIKPVFVFSKKADLRRYRKLVEAVKKVYPVAQAAKAQMVQMEAELLRLETKKEQKQYIKGIAAAIKKEYTPVLKHMTRTQGRVLLKLIDRETEYTAYEILREFQGRLRRGILAKRIAYLRTESQVGIRPRRGRQGARTDRSLLRSGAAVNRIRPPFTGNPPAFRPPAISAATGGTIECHPPPIRQTKIPIRARSPDHSIKIQIYLYFCSAFS